MISELFGPTNPFFFFFLFRVVIVVDQNKLHIKITDFDLSKRIIKKEILKEQCGTAYYGKVL